MCEIATAAKPNISSGRRLILPSRMMPVITPITEIMPRVIVAMIDALAPSPVDSRIVVP